MRVTIRRIGFVSVALSLARESECWIKRELQLDTIHQNHDTNGYYTHKLDIKDINFGMDDAMFTNSDGGNRNWKQRHRTLQKGSKSSKSKSSKSEKTNYSSDSHDDYPHATHSPQYSHSSNESYSSRESHSSDDTFRSQESRSSKSSKKSKSSHAGFMDEDIIGDFEELFGNMISDEFSMETKSKGTKSSKSSKTSGTKSGKKSTKSAEKSGLKLKDSKKTRPKQSKGSKSQKDQRPIRSKKSIPKLTMPPVEFSSSDDVPTIAPVSNGSQLPSAPPAQQPVTIRPADVSTDPPAPSPTLPPNNEPMTEAPVASMTPDTTMTPVESMPSEMTMPPDASMTPEMTVPPVETTAAPVETPPPVATMSPVQSMTPEMTDPPIASTPAPVETAPPVATMPPEESMTPEMTMPPQSTMDPTAALEIEVDVSPWALVYTLEGGAEPSPEDYIELEQVTAEFLRTFMENGFSQSPVGFIDFSTVLGDTAVSPDASIGVAYDSTGVFAGNSVVPNPTQLDSILEQAFSGESLVQYQMLLQNLQLMNPFMSATEVVFTRELPGTESVRSSSTSSSQESSSSSESLAKSSTIPGIAIGAATIVAAVFSAFMLKRRRDHTSRDKEESSEKTRLTGSTCTVGAGETATSDSGSLVRLWKHDFDEDEETGLSAFSNDNPSLYSKEPSVDVETVNSFGSNFSFRTPDEMAYTAKSFGIELSPADSQSDGESDEESNVQSRTKKTIPERRCDREGVRPWHKQSLNFSSYKNKARSLQTSEGRPEDDDVQREKLPLLDEESTSERFGESFSTAGDTSESESSDSGDTTSSHDIYGQIEEPPSHRRLDGSFNSEESSRMDATETSTGDKTDDKTDDDSDMPELTTLEEERVAFRARVDKDEEARKYEERQQKLAEKRLASEHLRQAAQEAIRRAEETRLEGETKLLAEREAFEARIKRQEDLRIQEETRLAKARVEFELRIQEEKRERLAEEARIAAEKKRADEALRKAEEDARAAEERRIVEEQKLAKAKAALDSSLETEERVLLRKEEELYLMKLKTEEEARNARQKQEQEIQRQKRELEERIRLQEEKRESEQKRLEEDRAALEERLSRELHARLAEEDRLAAIESGTGESVTKLTTRDIAEGGAGDAATRDTLRNEAQFEQVRAQKREIEHLLTRSNSEKLVDETVQDKGGYDFGEVNEEDASEWTSDNDFEGASSTADDAKATKASIDKTSTERDVGEEDIEFSAHDGTAAGVRKHDDELDEMADSESDDTVSPLIDAPRAWKRGTKIIDPSTNKVVAKGLSPAAFIAPWGDNSQSGRSTRSYGRDRSHRESRRQKDKSYRGSTRSRSHRSGRRSNRRASDGVGGGTSNPNDRSMSTKEMSYRKYRTRNFGSDEEDAPWWLPDDDGHDDESSSLASRRSFSTRERSITCRPGGSSDEDSSTYAASISSTSRSSGYIGKILPR